MEEFDLKALGCNTAESIHAMVEAKKLAFIDREAFVADPDYIDVPIEGLLSKQYARERAKLIDPERAAYDAKAGNPWAYQAAQPQGRPAKVGAGQEQEDTTCFVVVDGQGNAICQLAKHTERLGLQPHRRRYRHSPEQPHDLLAPGGGPC